jgi:hypothetical protein
LTANQSFSGLALWFAGRAADLWVTPIVVTDLDCIGEHGLNSLYCLNCPVFFAGCVQTI